MDYQDACCHFPGVKTRGRRADPIYDHLREGLDCLYSTSRHQPRLQQLELSMEHGPTEKPASTRLCPRRMLNTSGNFTTCRPQPISIIIPILLSVVFSIGFVLNCISLWIFVFRMKQWNSTVILQFNLAITDTIITPAAPLIIIYSLTDHWTFGTFFCQFKVFLLSTHMYGSIYFLTLISIHRYFSVAQNVKGKAWITKPFITKLSIVVWVFLFAQGIPFFFFLKTSEIHGVTKCLSIHQNDQAVLFFVWNWVILFSGLLVPFTITLVCYSLLSRYILNVNPMNTFTNVMVSKSVQIIFVSLIIFIICYIPVHVTRTIGVTVTLFFPTMCSFLEKVEVAYYITWMLSGTNCCMDPIIYCFASDRFNSTLTGRRSLRQRQGDKDRPDVSFRRSSPWSSLEHDKNRLSLA